MYLRVKEGKIVVTAPLWTSDKQIKKFIENNQEWIQTKLQKSESHLKSGDTIFILGHPFEIIFTTDRIDVKGCQIRVPKDQKIFLSFFFNLRLDDLFSLFQEI